MVKMQPGRYWCISRAPAPTEDVFLLFCANLVDLWEHFLQGLKLKMTHLNLFSHFFNFIFGLSLLLAFLSPFPFFFLVELRILYKHSLWVILQLFLLSLRLICILTVFKHLIIFITAFLLANDIFRIPRFIIDIFFVIFLKGIKENRPCNIWLRPHIYIFTLRLNNTTCRFVEP